MSAFRLSVSFSYSQWNEMYTYTLDCHPDFNRSMRKRSIVDVVLVT